MERTTIRQGITKETVSVNTAELILEGCRVTLEDSHTTTLQPHRKIKILCRTSKYAVDKML